MTEATRGRSTSATTSNHSTAARCILHENYFDLVRNVYSRCALVDQLALFTFVDRYVSPNHVIFFLMKESLNGGGAKARNGQRCSIGRNLVTVDDGTVDSLRRQKPVDFNPNSYERPASTQRLYLNSRRDYSDAIARLCNYEATNAAEVTASPRFRVPVGARVAVNNEPSFALDALASGDEYDDDEDDRDDAYNDDEQEGPPIVSTTLVRSQPPPPTKRARLDGSSHSGPRNVLKLFSSSARSVHQHYAEACQLLARFWSRCECENQLRRVEQRCSKVMTHITYLIQSNNILTNVVRSFELSSSVLCLFRETLTDTDSTPESQLLDQHVSWPVNETWTLHHEDACHNDRELVERENFARQLRIRVNKVRHSVGELVSRLKPIDRPVDGQPRDVATASIIGLAAAHEDASGDDEQRLFQLAKFSPAGHPLSASDFRAQHQSEFALASLRRMVDTVVRLAHTPCLKLCDFVLTSAADFWSLMHQCLDYAIACYEKTGLYPTKHSLWDIGLVQRNELSLRRSYGIENTDYQLRHYHLLWFHSPTLLAGNLTVFVQSFRRLFLTCFNTSACYMLNQAGARNRRKLGGKHECRLSKASQNAYHAVFLRMNLGHELLCKATIETMSEAVAWLERYAELAEALWLKLHIDRPNDLARHLTNLRSRLHYDANARRDEGQVLRETRDALVGARSDQLSNSGLLSERRNDQDDDEHNNDQVDEDRDGDGPDYDDESVLDYAFENESNY